MVGPEISVVIPVRDAESRLLEALDSISAQTFDNWECLVVDDGSRDGSALVAEARAAADARFRTLSVGGAGLVAALNAGLRAARAPLIARMDADDISVPSRLEAQAALMRARPELALCSCLVRMFPEESVGEGMKLYEEWLNSVVDEADILRDFFVESPFAHPSVMFRRDAALDAGGYLDNGWPEDYDLWMRLRERGARFAKVPEVLLYWRDYPERMSRTDAAYSMPRFRKLKARYLASEYLNKKKAATIWGAGREGRWWCAELSERGVDVRRFADVDPAKIGRKIGVIPIVSYEELADRRPDEFIFCAVGARGARPLIRSKLLEFGYVELEDFIFLA
jgi:glycosyltransferase involved in cell wall biosynthesis